MPRIVQNHYVINERLLRSITFDLQLDWDELEGSRKTNRIQDLITQLARNGRLEELVESLKKYRPKATWPTVPTLEQQKQDIRTAFPKKPLHQQPWVWAGAIALLAIIGISLTTWFGGQTTNRISRLPGEIAAAIPTNTPIPTPTITPTPSPTPLPFQPATEEETLIVIATFYRAEGLLQNAEVHNEIRRAIQANIDELELENEVQVKVEPSILRTENRNEAEALGNKYNATLIIWGEETSARIEVSFLNLKEPDFDAAEATISETENTQIASVANPEAYSAFVLEELPGQLGYLSFFALGQTAYSQEDYEEAIELIETAVALLPEIQETDEDLNLDDAFFRLGWLHQTNGQIEQAIMDYDEVITLNPDYAEAYNNRGMAFDALGEYEKEIADYNQAIALDPELAVTFYNRANAHRDIGKLEEAIADYGQAISLNPTYIDAYTNRGAIYRYLEEYDQAMADYNQALSIDPEFSTAYYNRGIVHSDRGEFDLAIADYNRAIALDPEYAFSFYNRGNIYRELFEYELAIIDYSQAINLDPDFAIAYYNRGVTYGDLKDYENALADYQKYITLDSQSTFSQAWNNVCWFGSLLGFAQDVKDACDEAVALAESAENEASFLDSRGLNRALRGDFEGAMSDFQSFVDYFQGIQGLEPYIEKRLSWISSLKVNQNPFDAETLQELLDE